MDKKYAETLRRFLPRCIIFAILLFCQTTRAQLQPPSDYAKDFDFFWQTINDEYCYFSKKQTDWQKVKDVYGPRAATATNRNQFVGVLEKVLYEIYDHHAILNTNTDSSWRLVPSGTDIWAEYINGKPTVVEVRRGFGAASCGIQPGMEIVSINDRAIDMATNASLPLSLRGDDVEAKNFVLRQLLAGDHLHQRKITMKMAGKILDYYPDNGGSLFDRSKYQSLIEAKTIGSVGMIRVNDCLYDNGLIPIFDSMMEKFASTSALILDLRETPSGGNTSVARAILGWFIRKEHFYQKHEYPNEEKTTGVKRSWMEIVSPRVGKYYGKPLVILCDHWTGSIAEGIVIGFDALHRPNTRIIGTKLARLNGAVYTFELPVSKIHFSFPAEKLYHVNGLPRENYVPTELVDVMHRSVLSDEDPFLSAAIRYLKKVR